MKKILLVLLICLSLLLFTSPSQASIEIVGIYYNPDATPNEAALRIDWSNPLRPDTVVKGDQFKIIRPETTIGDIEERIVSAVYDTYVKITPLSQFPQDDPVRADPPVLTPNEIIVNNKLYYYEAWFAIHIYSLDDPVTIGISELRFVTRFQNPQYGTIPDNWW